MVCSLFLFAISQSDSGTLNYGSRWRAKKNMPEHIHWILPTCLYIIFTFAMTKNYLHTMLFVFGWSILFYRFNVVLTMRNREEALAHCRARRVYILQSPPHCLHPPSHAANAISSFYNSYSFFRSSQFSCKILVIYWRLIVLFCFAFQSCFRNISRSGLFPYIQLKCERWTALYIHENTNIYIPSVA